MTEPENANSDDYAHGLVAAYAIVYFGLAVCDMTGLMAGN